MENKAFVNEAFDKTIKKITETSKRIGSTFPHVSVGGKYNDSKIDWWTNGFWPGILWLIYDETKDERLKEIAVNCEIKLQKNFTEFYNLDHDSGFIWMPTAVSHFRMTGNKDSRRRALTAASHLAGRFNLAGRFIRAWNDWGDQNKTGWAIVDCLMNLSLLYWASGECGDPRFKHIAKAHAETALKYFIREDGSTNHIICFNPETGEFENVRGGQGYSENSAWSRGNAWAIYGMALSARYTGEDKFLQAAKKTAKFFLSNLPDDFVPYWDFRAPLEDDMPRDSTAAACAACGLLEIASLDNDDQKDFYINSALKIVKSLYDNYGAWGSDEEALIIKGTGNRPANDNVNVPIIYGDYFFTEALYRLKGKSKLLW